MGGIGWRLPSTHMIVAFAFVPLLSAWLERGVSVTRSPQAPASYAAHDTASPPAPLDCPTMAHASCLMPHTDK